MTHIIFDCDDVLLAWQSSFFKYVSDRGYRPDPKGPNDWLMAAWIGCNDAEAKALIRSFNASPAFGEIAAYPGAVDVVWALRDAGHTMSVMTCCGTSNAVKQARVANLNAMFTRDGLLPFTDYKILDMGDSKFKALYEMTQIWGSGKLCFVEDNFNQAKAGVVNGIRSYCIRRTHNWDDEATDTESEVIWVNGLEDVLEREIGR